MEDTQDLIFEIEGNVGSVGSSDLLGVVSLVMTGGTEALHLGKTSDSFEQQTGKKAKTVSRSLARTTTNICNGVQREHNKKLNNGLPILHKVPPKRDYGRYFCIMAEKGGTSHGGLTEKLSLFFHAKKQEVNAYGR